MEGNGQRPRAGDGHAGRVRCLGRQWGQRWRGDEYDFGRWAWHGGSELARVMLQERVTRARVQARAAGAGDDGDGAGAGGVCTVGQTASGLCRHCRSALPGSIRLYTDLTPSGDKMVLELQNLVFSSQ